MKTCFKCHAELPLIEFYRHSMMADGHLNKCKDCTKRDVTGRYKRLTATPEGLEAERYRGREKYHRLYSPGPNWQSPPASKEQKMKASSALGRAVRRGDVVKPRACNDCGTMGKRLHGHHEDYEKLLAVIWVCPLCHRRRHAPHPDRVKGKA